MGRKGRIPAETLLGLRTRLANLSARDTQRRVATDRVAELFRVSFRHGLSSSTATPASKSCDAQVEDSLVRAIELLKPSASTRLEGQEAI
ncbi:hypothetical protein C6558_37810 [Ensifer sp. NM-2]|uniref:hypothetical protein n=1 Tax=Ensifer sp. NM-2 TaxID=2109730 RepID=UPI000D12E925|nr:hypothetical protein [Ensifer sp. NM-2]PSS59537.1 hypothetical protein C6558_37810 [Ensifer sp. NM-2]